MNATSGAREVSTDELRAVEGGAGFGFGTSTLITATSNLRVEESASTPMKSNAET